MSDRMHDPFERSLLDAAKSDGMPADRKRALAAALAGTAVLSLAGSAKAGASAAAVAKKGGAGLALAKWIAAGAFGSALVAGATTGAVHVYERAASAPTSVSTSPPRPRAPAPVPVPVPVPEPAPITEEPPPQPTPAPTAPPARPAPRATARPISAELVVIDRARTALASGDLAAADAALTEHQRSFPNGVFRDEARVLRIDALARRGDRARAASAARAYLAANPDSPYASRVRGYLGEEARP